MRDLQKDLETCNKATSGPWDVFPVVCGPEGQTVFQVGSGGDICEVADPYPRGENRPTENMHFIAQAREGWPHAIERAIKAEKLNRDLAEAMKVLNCGDNSCHFAERSGMGTNGGCRCLSGIPEPLRRALLRVWYIR